MDAALLALGLALAAGWVGGRTALLGVAAGAAIALADFWCLSGRVELDGEARRAIAWIAAAGLRLTGVAVAVALLFVTGWFHPVALVIGLAVLPCALVARGLHIARQGA
jgi:ATP synthase I chain